MLAPEHPASARVVRRTPLARHRRLVAAALAALVLLPGDAVRPAVARDRVRRYVELARSEGGDVALGGQALDRDGWWFAPTVVGGLDVQSRLVREEVLGPLLMVVPDSRRGSSARA